MINDKQLFQMVSYLAVGVVIAIFLFFFLRTTVPESEMPKKTDKAE